ncbi:sulfotransferase family protein [Diaphorobacter sp. HDW4A]|uniref:sulfotransferase family protein n=1 Tax=Diaphorobacter sp. HDW4A TaxID=2714924 RepID=UPI00140E0FEB|nr:sulfotransferase family protein [Diaphorobacter sp. HDW4A]QIL80124.1 sulfotransferase family protein [Diaphorobacter sp. HDW4A]
MDDLNLRGWRPIRLHWNGSQVMVDWALLGDAPHLAPFYQQSVGAQMSKPFHQAFRRETTLKELLDWQQASPGLAPCLVVFHVSRCGSTLIPQALAQSLHHLALSEPAPLDFLARDAVFHGWLDEAQAVDAMRAWLSAWAQRSDGSSPALHSVSVKLDAWNTGRAALFSKAWPQAQTAFITREPLAVLVSQMRERGFFLVPGALGESGGLAGLSRLEQAVMPADLFCARMLSRIYEDMVVATDPAHSLVIDHSELPDAIEARLLPRLKWQPLEPELTAMRERLTRHGKRPQESFSGDTIQKNDAATERLRELSREWLKPHYSQLLSGHKHSKEGRFTLMTETAT